MGRVIRWSAAVWLLPMVFLSAVEPLPDEESGRLLRRVAPGEEMFLVFREQAAPGRYLCSPLSGTGTVSVAVSDVEVLPFYETVSPALLSEYLLMGVFCGEDYTMYAALARRLGSSPRFVQFEKFRGSLTQLFRESRDRIRKLNELAGELRNLPAAGDGDARSAEEIEVDLDLCGNELSEQLERSGALQVVQEALSGGDLLQATVLFEYFRQFVRRNFIAYLPRNGGCERSITEFFDSAGESLVRECGARHDLGSGRDARAEAFRKLFPEARGLWSEGPPGTYRQLQENIRRSFQSFRVLEELSEVAEFEAWGSRMLDVLLFSRGTPEAKELETNFDSALQNYRKRFHK